MKICLLEFEVLVSLFKRPSLVRRINKACKQRKGYLSLGLRIMKNIDANCHSGGNRVFFTSFLCVEFSVFQQQKIRILIGRVGEFVQVSSYD